MNAEQFDLQKRKVTRSRAKWPFRNMKVGDVVSLDDGTHKKTLPEIQIYCHVYGHQSGKTFETFTNEGKIHIKRVS